MHKDCNRKRLRPATLLLFASTPGNAAATSSYLTTPTAASLSGRPRFASGNTARSQASIRHDRLSSAIQEPADQPVRERYWRSGWANPDSAAISTRPVADTLFQFRTVGDYRRRRTANNDCLHHSTRFQRIQYTNDHGRPTNRRNRFAGRTRFSARLDRWLCGPPPAPQR